MSLGKEDPPTPPSPVATAGTQTATNVSTAVANAFLNNTNQNTPLGSLTYDQGAGYNFTDPSTGVGYSIPTFIANQTLSPSQQAIQDESQGAKFNLANLSNEQSGKLNSLLGSPFDLSGAPTAADPSLLDPSIDPSRFIYDDYAQQSGFGDAGNIQRQVGSGGLGITGDYGPQDSFSADRARVEESLYGRLNPQLAKERGRIEQQLSDQGIRYGGGAYTAAMDDYNRQANDARLAVTQAGGAEQQRMMDMAAKRAGFQNAAQQQEYQELLGRGQFANQAQQQDYLQQFGRGQFYNAAQHEQFAQAATRAQQYNAALAQQMSMRQAQFNARNVARPQYLAEQYALRNQPINEITALLSGSQVQQPSFMTTPQNQIPTTDVANLINQNFNQNLDIFKTQSASQNQLLGGLFGLAGNAINPASRLSDRRAKKDVHRIGTVFAATPHEVEEPYDVEETSERAERNERGERGERKRLPIYNYAYKGDPASMRHIGPMAQDVEKIDPAAVRTRGGMKHIDERRVMGSILRAA